MPIPRYTPDYGPDVSPTFPNVGFPFPGQGLLPMQGPMVPEGFGPNGTTDLAPQVIDPTMSTYGDMQGARRTFMDAVMDQGNVPPMDYSPPPGLSGLQALIGGGLGIIGAASGANGVQIAGQYAQGARGFNKEKWAAMMQKMEDQRKSEIERKRLKAQVAQLDYEDKAREHGHQVQRKEQLADREQAQRDRMAYEQAVEDRMVKVQGAKSAAQQALEDRKLRGDPDAILTEQYFKGEITKEQWLDGVSKYGPSRVREGQAKIKELDARAARQLSLSRLDAKKVDEIAEKVKYFRPLHQAKVAQLYASAARARQSGTGKVSDSAARAAANFHVSSLKTILQVTETEIKEIEGLIQADPVNMGEHIDDLLRLGDQRDELRQQIVDASEENAQRPKATAPKQGPLRKG